MANSQGPVIPLHHTFGSMGASAAPELPITATTSDVSGTHQTASHNASDLPPDSPPGYPKLAEIMNRFPEAAIFRRFGTMNALNLLYLQAELMDIEERLQEAQILDHQNLTGHKSLYAKNWYFLSESARDGDEAQLKLVELSRQKLEKYNTALVHQERILAMKAPGAYDLKFVQKYLACNDSGAFALTGLDANVWGAFLPGHPTENANDLVALKPRHDEDIFSRWVTGKGISKFLELGRAQFRNSSLVHRFVGYEDRTLRRITYTITNVLASLIPITSIVILYSVESTEIRLAIIALFNIVLSFCLTAFTAAKRAEVFGVAAAFSAVQVVFVQGGVAGT